MREKIIGIIPARMAASRFPGKPLKKIHGIPMLMHVFLRAKLFNNWDKLLVAGCDNEILNYCLSKKISYIPTSTKHKRCLDRVYEAAKKISRAKYKINKNDIIVCVQGDEPMLRPDMVEKVVKEIKKNRKAGSIVLAMSINNEKQFNDPNVVKIIHNKKMKSFTHQDLPYHIAKSLVQKFVRKEYMVFLHLDMIF